MQCGPHIEQIASERYKHPRLISLLHCCGASLPSSGWTTHCNQNKLNSEDSRLQLCGRSKTDVCNYLFITGSHCGNQHMCMSLITTPTIMDVETTFKVILSIHSDRKNSKLCFITDVFQQHPNSYHYFSWTTAKESRAFFCQIEFIRKKMRHDVTVTFCCS